MTCCNNPCSAALSLIALLLFTASTPPPVHGQITIPGIRIPPIINGILSPLGIPQIGIPPISGILPPIGIPPISGILPPIGIPPISGILPPIGIPPIGIPPISGILSPLGVSSIGTNPIILTVTGQICCTTTGNCPGQGAPGLPVSLTCITNNVLGVVSTVSGQSITDSSGRFTVAVSVPPGLVPTISQQVVSSLLPCLVTSTLLPAVNAVSCPLLGSTSGLLLSLVQSSQSTVSPLLNQAWSASATGFIVLRI